MKLRKNYYRYSLITLAIFSFSSVAEDYIHFDNGTDNQVTENATSKPLSASGAGTTVTTSDGLIFSTDEDFTPTIKIDNEATVTLNNATLQTEGERSSGVAATNASLVFNSGSISTAGNNTHGIHAINSDLDLSGVSIVASAGGSYGIYMEGGTLNAHNNVSINSLFGDDGIVLTAGAIASLDDVRIKMKNNTTAEQAIKVSESQLTGNNVHINIGGSATGLELNNTTLPEGVTLSNSKITTADGIGVLVTSGKAELSDVTVTSQTNNALQLNNNSNVTLQGGSYQTTGKDAVLLNNDTSQLTATQGTEFATAGDNAHALHLVAGKATLTGTTLKTSGTGSNAIYSDSTVEGDSLTIITTGEQSAAVVTGKDSNTTLTTSDIKTSGAGSHALQTEGGVLNITDSEITVQGDNAWGLNAVGFDDQQPSAVTLDNTRLITQNSETIHTEGARLDLHLANGTTLSGKDIALNAKNSAMGQISDVRVTADKNVEIQGNIRADTGSSLTLDMTNSSVLSGATTDVTRLSLDNSSRWNINDNSNVHDLMMSGYTVFNANNNGFKTLTVDNDLTGSGTFVFNTQLGNDNSPTDFLNVKGNASGDFNVVVNNKGGEGDMTDKGIPLIHVDQDASGATFNQEGGVPIGNYEYFLNQVSPNDWYLQASYTGGSEPGDEPNLRPNPGEDLVQVPTFRPEIAGYQISPWLNADYAFTATGTWHQRQGAWRDEHNGWGRVWGERDRLNSGRFGYHTNTFFMQLGNDLWQSQLTEDITATAGIMLTFGTLHTRASDQARLQRPTLSASTGKIRTNAWTVGGYYTLTTKGNAYLDAVVQETYFRTHFDSASRAKQNSASTLMSVELGVPFSLADKFQLEPQVQLMGQWVKSGNTGAEGIQVKGNNQALGMGRAGVRLSYEADTVQPYIQADVVQRAGRVKGARMRDLIVDPNMQSGWWKTSAGINGQVTSNMSVYAEAEYKHGFNQGKEGYSGNLGVKYSF
ncbi:autotransporter outer membrane beta-barrel domain-containing protein [Enterobacteriaceae bacterium LUAb1]